MARVRLSDVAAAAGVSTATVSLVLNGVSGRVSAPTAQKVRAAADALGYTPNSAARSLRTRRTRTIGVITDSVLTSASAAALVQGAQEIAWDNDHLMLWLAARNELELMARAVQTLRARQVDGLIVAAMYHRELEFGSDTLGVPTVGLNAVSADPEVPCFVPDDFAAAQTATRVLIDAGHRRIAHITDPPGDGLARGLRIAGYRSAMRQAGIDYDRVLVPEAGYLSSEPAQQQVLRALRTPNQPTAFFAFNDIAAVGVYRAARRLGLRIPDDLSVVGFDDYLHVASEQDPGLTTMALPLRELGQRATRALLCKLGVLTGEPGSGIHRIPCPLVARQSVAHLPRTH